VHRKSQDARFESFTAMKIEFIVSWVVGQFSKHCYPTTTPCHATTQKTTNLIHRM
jgi:hypothetical protein